MEWNQVSSLAFVVIGFYALVIAICYVAWRIRRKALDEDTFMKRHVRFETNAIYLFGRQRKRVESISNAIDLQKGAFADYLLAGRCRKLTLELVRLSSLKANIAKRIDEEMFLIDSLETGERSHVLASHARWIGIIKDVDAVIKQQTVARYTHCV